MASSFTHHRPLRGAQPAAHSGTPAGWERAALPNDIARPLPPALAQDLGQRFGANFASVRLHEGTAAHVHAEALNARAYTVGEHVVLGRNAPPLASQQGRRTLAHELTHVVQQRRGGPPPELSSDAPHEVAAERAASQATSGSGPISVGGGTGVGVSREEDDKKKKKGTGKPKWTRGLTAKQQRDAQRKKDVLEEFSERAHDPQAELAEERTTKRSRKSEQARHADRSQNVDKHHGYPKFIGGNKIQTYIKLTKDLHYLYHEELYLLLEKELKALGKLPKEAGRPSRRHYGNMVRSLTPAQKKALLEKVIAHARKFDNDPARRAKYPDKRQKLEVAVRRGIREAERDSAAKKKQKGKPRAPAKGATTSAKPRSVSGVKRAAAPRAKSPAKAAPTAPAAGSVQAPGKATLKQAPPASGAKRKASVEATPQAPVKASPPTTNPAPPVTAKAAPVAAPKAELPASTKPAAPARAKPPSKPPGSTKAHTGVADTRVPGGPPQSAGAAKMHGAAGALQLAGQGATALGNYVQGRAAEEAYQRMLPAILAQQAATDQGLWVHFTYSQQGSHPDSVFTPVPIFTGIELQEGTRTQRRPPALLTPGGAKGSVTSRWLPPGKHSLKNDLADLWQRQKSYQRWGERESKRTFVGRFLLERKGSSIDISPVYEARAHLVSARIAIEQDRPAAAEASMAAADAALDTFLQRAKDYAGKQEF